MKNLILLLLVTSSTIYAESGVFSVGSKNIGVTVGTDNSFGNNYTVLGATVHYFIVDNLSIGASYQTYLGDKPSINQITVPVTYYLPLENTMYKPYLGAFYNRTFIEKPYKDYNIYGGRAGLSLQTSANSYMSFGWVQEFSNDGNNNENRGYPEFTGGFSF